MESNMEHHASSSRRSAAQRNARRKKARRRRILHQVTIYALFALFCVALILGIYGIYAGIRACTKDVPHNTEGMESIPAPTSPKPDTPTLSRAEQTVRAYAQEHNISYSRYPQSLIELLERNPETESFVLNYPFHGDATHDLSKYDRTKGVPLFLQWDPQWGYEIYGSDVLGITGCGPTCLAMAGYYLTGDSSFTPDQMAQFSEDYGYYYPGQGSGWALISEGGKRLALDVAEIPLGKQRVLDNLQAGNPIICAMGPGDFTTEGHYILLAGCEDGKIRVNDPNSIEKSQRLWDYETLESQIANLWVLRK